MANPLQGQVALVVSDGEAYTMRLTINRIITLTKEFGEDALWQRWLEGKATLEEIRAILHQALLEQKPNLKLEDVGDIMQRLGPDGLAKKPWRTVLLLAFDTGEPPSPKGAQESESSPTTGESSSSKRSSRGSRRKRSSDPPQQTPSG